MNGRGRTLSSARAGLSSIRSRDLFIDARIPVEFLAGQPDRPQAGQALLLSPSRLEAVEGALEASGGAPQAGWMVVVRLPPAPGVAGATMAHGSGCACCTGRSEQARALTLLFQARAKGAVGFFRGVVAVLLPEEAAVLRGLLETDPFLSGCFVATDETIEHQS
nr:hypothetical protein [uncultured Lichenicoccus sp.]